MAIEVFNRYEKKFFVYERQISGVLSEIERHMVPDKFSVERGTYSISNIYFDTEDDYLIRTSLSKPVYKEKIRLRTYGTPTREGKAFLEIKKKVNGLVNKRRTQIGLPEANLFIQNGGKAILTNEMNPQVTKELSCMAKRYDLKPKVMIAYDRIAYFEKGNPDLRISFDFNIRSRREQLRLDEGSGGALLLPRDLWLMEIKTAKAMPLWLTGLISKEQIRNIRFSKYGTEYTNYLRSKHRKEAVHA